MTELLVTVLVIIGVASFVLLLVLLARSSSTRLLKIESSLQSIEKNNERLERAIREEMFRNREEVANNARQLREEVSRSLKSLNDSLINQFEAFSKQLVALTQSNEQRLERMRDTVEERLRLLQEDNARRLEQMRETVDERLHSTLEKRLGQSFKLVSDRLEQVYKGLGEMQALAVGVGDLKRVLSNVKTRGILGEIQLGRILEQILTPEQYARNVVTKKGGREAVEYVIKLPGRDDTNGFIYLPIDSKFPIEHYHSLVDAYEKGDQARVDEVSKLLENTIKKCAKDIRDKYIDPPNTTDFGIMFLPVEGLYAEVVRRTSLMESLQRDFKVNVVGPSTLSAFLNSLQMGFRTLAIEKRSSEVWTLLGAVKTEFGKFGGLLEKTKKKLDETANVIDDAARRSRVIERRLRDVQELPPSETIELLGDTGGLRYDEDDK
jgi:DNA recombination protein RmuC